MDGAAKSVEDAPILMHAAQGGELLVEPPGIAAANVQVHQIPGETRPDARNALKFLQRSGGLVIV